MNVQLIQPKNVPTSQLSLSAQDAQVSEQVAAQQSEEVITALGAYIRRQWDAAYDAKIEIEDIMHRALRQRNGKYEADKQRYISSFGGSDIYMRVTDVKCIAAESLLRDILLDSGTPPWDIAPTPIPELTPEEDADLKSAFAEEVVRQITATQSSLSPAELRAFEETFRQQYRQEMYRAANNRVAAMKLKIADQFAQGGWAESFSTFITDIVTFPAAFLKGPVVRRQRKLGYEKQADGTTKVVTEEVMAPEFNRVDPFAIYPEPGITELKDGYVFEHHLMSTADLSNLIGVAGYDEPVIRDLLAKGAPVSWLHRTQQQQKDIEERKFRAWDRRTEMYDALEFWGKVSGRLLLEWGMNPSEVPDPARMYDANIWMVGGQVLKAVLNYDPLGRKPYVKASFRKAPGAFWGRGIPEIISDLQGVCNGAMRSLVNNMAIASGPMVEINLDRWPSNQPIRTLEPWMILQTQGSVLGANDPAVRFHQPVDNSDKLMMVYEKAAALADIHSGIPAVNSGDFNVQGAGRTSSGLSMLIGEAGKGIRDVIMSIDLQVIKPIVEQQFMYNMRFDKDESIKGDVQIITKGAHNLATRDTDNVRRLEMLDRVAGNPLLAEIVGIEGISTLLKATAKGINLDGDEFVPSKEKRLVETTTAQLAEQAGGGQGQQQAAPQAVHPDGGQKGGAAGTHGAQNGR